MWASSREGFALIFFVFHFTDRFFNHLSGQDGLALARGDYEQPFGTASEVSRKRLRLAARLLSLAHALAERCTEGNSPTAGAEHGQLVGFIVKCHGSSAHISILHPICN